MPPLCSQSSQEPEEPSDDVPELDDGVHEEEQGQCDEHRNDKVPGAAALTQFLLYGPRRVLHQRLRAKLEWVYFLSTSRYVIPGLLISLAAVIRSGLTIQGVERQVMLPVAIGGVLWSVACLFVGGFAIGTIKNIFLDPHHLPTARRQAIVVGVALVVLVIGELVGLVALAWAASPEVAALLAILVGIVFLWLYLDEYQWKAKVGPGAALPRATGGALCAARLEMTPTGAENA